VKKTQKVETQKVKTQKVKTQKVKTQKVKSQNAKQKKCATFPCLKCDKVFTRRDHLQSHTDKNACKEYTHYCKFCNKGFTSETSMYRHIRTACKAKIENDKEKDDIYEKIKKIEEQMKNMAKDYKAIKKENEKMKKENKENKELTLKIEKENKKLTHRIENVERFSSVIKDNNNVDINNGTVNNTNNIILVGYGKEDLSKINKKKISKAMQ